MVDIDETLADNSDCNEDDAVAETECAGAAFVALTFILFFNIVFQRDRLTGHRLQMVTAGKVS